MPNAGEGLKRLDYRIEEWDRDFQDYLTSLSKTKAVILAGDLNVAHNEIDIYDTKNKEKVPGFTPQERQSFGHFLAKSGFVDCFRHFNPTVQKFSFWSMRARLRPENKGWRLDYFVASALQLKGGTSGLEVAGSEIHTEVMGSDHCPISLSFKSAETAANF